MSKFTPFSLPPGLARQGTDRMLAGRWYDASMVRWRQGVVQAIGGWERITDEPLPSPIRTIYGLASQNDARIIALGCDDHIFCLWESEVMDITPEGFQRAELNITEGGYGVGNYSDGVYGLAREEPQPDDFIQPNYISLDAWGEYLVACSSADGKLYYFNPAEGPDLRLKPLPKNPTSKGSIPISCRAVHVTPERHMLVIGADGDPRRLAWCSREDFGDWQYTRTAEEGGSAGFLTMDTATELQTMKGVREGTLVFSDTDVFLVRYKGNPYIFGQEKLLENTSLMSPYSAATFDGKCVWMTRTGGFMLYDAGYAKPLPCEIEDYIYDDMDPFWNRIRSHAVVNNIYSEVWFFYRSKDAVATGPGGTQTMWALRNSDNEVVEWLTYIDEPPDVTYMELFDDLGTTRIGWANNDYTVYFSDSHVRERDVSTDCDSYVMWNYDDNVWSKGRLWRSAGIPYLINRYPFMAGPDQHVYRHEKGTIWNAPGRDDIYLESAAISPGNGGIVTVKQLIPDDRTVYNGAQITFYSKMTPEQVESEHGPYISRPDGYMDVRFSGRDIRMRLEQISDSDWTVGKQEIDIAQRGKR